MIQAPSPNHEPRPGGKPVDLLVLHYTGMATAEAAIARLRDPQAKVSAHYIVEIGGRVLQLVPEHRRAWHAGKACWAGEADVNGRSIGIELVNGGHAHGLPPFPEAQLGAVVRLVSDIAVRRRIPAHRVVGHSDVAPQRKADPGERFPWSRLAANGLALAPAEGSAPESPSPRVIQRALAAVGYCVPLSGARDAPTRAALAAFQRRFHPDSVTGEADAVTLAKLDGAERALTESASPLHQTT